MKELRGCLDVLPPRLWSFAVMRAGVHSGMSFSRAEVGRRMKLSPPEVRRLEHKVLRTLRQAHWAQGCSGGSTGPAGGLSEVSSLILVDSLTTATSPPDALEVTDASATADASGTLGAPVAGGEGEERGDSEGGAVAGVFERGSLPAGIGASLLRVGEPVPAVAVSLGALLLMAAALRVYRRRSAQ